MSETLITEHLKEAMSKKWTKGATLTEHLTKNLREVMMSEKEKKEVEKFLKDFVKDRRISGYKKNLEKTVKLEKNGYKEELEKIDYKIFWFWLFIVLGSFLLYFFFF